jgi:hypothetical protein
MSHRSQKIILIFLIILISSWIFISELFKRSPDFKKEAIDFVEKNIQEPLLPEPLRYAQRARNAILTVQGSILETNKQRAQNGLGALSENSLLRQVAEFKIQDMFKRQYFAHYAPDGTSGVSDLADKYGYNYIAIGENLALGNFENDTALIQAWMNSPGHRANILNKNYTEIGIAVGKGVFEGQTTWLAVQAFGKPLSSCPTLSTSLKSAIDSNSDRLNIMESNLGQMRAELDLLKKADNRPIYNQKVDEYNNLVSEYNYLASETKKMIADYNNQVSIFNECANLK